MKKIFTFISLLVGLQSLSFACSCIDTGSFCESVSFLKKIEDLEFNVVHAIVAEKDETGVKITVLQTYFGNATAGSKFTIRNGGGWDCTISTDAFDIGKTYIFALEFPASQAQQLSNCGTFYLRVENEKVMGNIAPGVNEVSLDEFVNLPNCGDLQGFGTPTFKLNSTLTNNQELWAFPDFWIEPADVEIRLFDINGRLMQSSKHKNFVAFEPIEINTNGWPAGVYCCQFLYLGIKQTIRFVKVE